MAKRVWDLVYPTIKTLLKGRQFKTTRLVVNSYLENVPLMVRRIINTILQIMMDQIWLDHNLRQFESISTPINKTRALISLTFNKVMRRTFRRIPLAAFKAKCCHRPSVCKVIGDDTVITNIFLPDT